MDTMGETGGDLKFIRRGRLALLGEAFLFVAYSLIRGFVRRIGIRCPTWMRMFARFAFSTMRRIFGRRFAISKFLKWSTLLQPGQFASLSPFWMENAGSSPEYAALVARVLLFYGKRGKAVRECLDRAEPCFSRFDKKTREAFLAAKLFYAKAVADESGFETWRGHPDAPAWVAGLEAAARPPKFSSNCVSFDYSAANYLLRPFAVVRDRCPSCGHEAVFSEKTRNVPWKNDHDWLCPNCLAMRYWDFDESAAAGRRHWSRFVASLQLRNGVLKPASVIAAGFMLQALSPFMLIRIGRPIEAVGHQAFDVMLYLLARLNGMHPKSLDYVDLTTGNVNGTVLKLWKRSISFLRHDPAIGDVEFGILAKCLSDAKIQGFSNRVEFAAGKDEHDFLRRGDIPWVFTAREMKRGYESLSKMGVPLGAPFACLLVRDDAYDSQARIINPEFHYPHRNADVNTYRPAMERLAERGWSVLRMGAVVEKAIAWKSARIIDYAMEHRTAFMDIWLVSQCGMMVSTAAGIDSIATILKKPVVYTNLHVLFWPHGNYFPVLILHKNFVTMKGHKKLSKLTVMRTGRAEVFYKRMFREAEMWVEDNTSREILEIVEEMLEVVEGRHTVTEKDERAQRRFWQTLAGCVPSFPQHAPRYRIGREVLRRDPDFFGPGAEKTDALPHSDLPWDGGDPVSPWSPSDGMIRDAYDDAMAEEDMETREELLLQIVWSRPGHAEASRRLAEIYRNLGYAETALLFAANAFKAAGDGEDMLMCRELHKTVFDRDMPSEDISGFMEQYVSEGTRLLFVDRNLLRRMGFDRTRGMAQQGRETEGTT